MKMQLPITKSLVVALACVCVSLFCVTETPTNTVDYSTVVVVDYDNEKMYAFVTDNPDHVDAMAVMGDFLDERIVDIFGGFIDFGPNIDTVPGIGTYGPNYQPGITPYVPSPFDPDSDFFYPPHNFFEPWSPDLDNELDNYDDDIMLLVTGDIFQRQVVANDKDYRYAVVELELNEPFFKK